MRDKEFIYGGMDCWLMGNDKTVNKEFLKYVAETATGVILQELPSDIRTMQTVEVVIEEIKETVRNKTHLETEAKVKMYANNEAVEERASDGRDNNKN